MNQQLKDGSEQTRLTNNEEVDDLWPSWSPYGTKIAFESRRDGLGEIYIMNAADGSEQTRLTTIVGAYDPDWGPATDTD
jgi:Tol biopolymer transport system component